MNLPNLLSLMRGVSAFLFLSESLVMRSIAIIVAVATDWFDGYFARHWQQKSRLGTLLDPLMDKFFVLFILIVFVLEKKISLLEINIFLSRDYAILIFAAYLFIKGEWGNYRIHAFWVGKVATTLQFLVLLGLTFNYPIPNMMYTCFILIGPLSLLELALRKKEFSIN